MSRTRRLATALLITGTLALSQAGLSLAESGPTIECGQVAGYTAPDPVAPAPGSLAIGTLTPWEVLATATVSADAAASLPSLLNSSPTCVSVELDADGKVTSIDFAAEGDITGPVSFDSGSDSYLFADRLIVPTFVTDTYPGLGALFVTSSDAGTTLTVTFSVDVSNGTFTGFDGHAAFCGPGSVADGDGKVGDATLLADVLEPEDLEALQDADGDVVCATVHSIGVIAPDSEGQIDVDTDVVIALQDVDPVPTQPPTSTAGASTTSDDSDLPELFLGLVICLGIILVTSRLSPASRRG